MVLLLPSGVVLELLLIQQLIRYFFQDPVLRHTKVVVLHLIHHHKLEQCFVLQLPFHLLQCLDDVLKVAVSFQLQVFSVQGSYCLFQVAKSTFVVVRSTTLACASLSELDCS